MEKYIEKQTSYTLELENSIFHLDRLGYTIFNY